MTGKKRSNVLYILFVLLFSCSHTEQESTFIQKKYSSTTNEIFDHVLLELLKAGCCYETIDSYIARTGDGFEHGDTTAARELWDRFLEEREIAQKQQVLLVDDRLFPSSLDTTNRSNLKRSVNFLQYGNLPSDHSQKLKSFRLSALEKQLFTTLMDSMRSAKVSVTELANTGCYYIVGLSGAKVPPGHLPKAELRDNQELCGSVAISEPIVSDEGLTACFYYEFRSGPKSAFGNIVFVEKRNNRWHLTHLIDNWVS